jgi:hypothetical protein
MSDKTEARLKGTIHILQDLIAELSGGLADEGGQWSSVGLNNLRRRAANALPPDKCPDWLNDFRDPALVQSGAGR